MIVRPQFPRQRSTWARRSAGRTVTATSAEIGDNTDDVDASVEGEAQHVAFNGRYLRDALEAQQAFLEVAGPASPGVIRPASGPNGYLHVIMPMHVAR